MVFLDLFSYRWQWLPLGGFAPPPGGTAAGGFSLMGVARHLVLPVLVLTLSSAAAKLLVMRNAVSRARDEAYVLYTRARGVEPWRVLFIHVFRNACLPLLHLAALHLGFVVSGAVLVEVVFSINGMGSLIHEAALHRDYPVLQGSFLVLTLVVMGLNVLADLASGLLDPRVRA
jgi:peptide/nickel transport system permease protein